MKWNSHFVGSLISGLLLLMPLSAIAQPASTPLAETSLLEHPFQWVVGSDTLDPVAIVRNLKTSLLLSADGSAFLEKWKAPATDAGIAPEGPQPNPAQSGILHTRGSSHFINSDSGSVFNSILADNRILFFGQTGTSNAVLKNWKNQIVRRFDKAVDNAWYLNCTHSFFVCWEMHGGCSLLDSMGVEVRHFNLPRRENSWSTSDETYNIVPGINGEWIGLHDYPGFGPQGNKKEDEEKGYYFHSWAYHVPNDSLVVWSYGDFGGDFGVADKYLFAGQSVRLLQAETVEDEEYPYFDVPAFLVLLPNPFHTVGPCRFLGDYNSIISINPTDRSTLLVTLSAYGTESVNHRFFFTEYDSAGNQVDSLTLRFPPTFKQPRGWLQGSHLLVSSSEGKLALFPWGKAAISDSSASDRRNALPVGKKTGTMVQDGD